MSRTMNGGCQCGRVRYAATLDGTDAYLCHCRKCQKATGGFAAAFVEMPHDRLQWLTEPDWYASSPVAKRPFCAACGTPLGFAWADGTGGVDITVGSFDDPSRFVPVAHAGAESLHEAWLDTRDLPRHYSGSTESVVRHWAAAGLAVPS